MKRSVFFTYGRDDKGFAMRLADKMREKGIEVFDPEIEVTSGEVWAQTVRKAISNANAVVAILPMSGTPGSNNAFFEIGLARTMNKKVLAVTPDRLSSGDRELPQGLLDLLVLDGANKSAETIVDTLSQALRAA